MTINVPQAANQTTLHIESNNKTRRIYMIRSRVDFQGNLHEENRTTFHLPEWTKLNEKRWVQKRDHFIKKFNDTMSEFSRKNNYNIKQLELS